MNLSRVVLMMASDPSFRGCSRGVPTERATAEGRDFVTNETGRVVASPIVAWMALWCAALAVAALVFAFDAFQPKLVRHGPQPSESLFANVARFTPAVGYAWATYRYIQLWGGRVLPNLWGVRLFSALMFIPVLSGGVILAARMGTGGGLVAGGFVVVGSYMILNVPILVLHRTQRRQVIGRRRVAG